MSELAFYLVGQYGVRSPFPYFGGSRDCAPLVWRALGDVQNYVEPCFGSGAVLLARPHEPNRTRTEESILTRQLIQPRPTFAAGSTLEPETRAAIIALGRELLQRLIIAPKTPSVASVAREAGVTQRTARLWFDRLGVEPKGNRLTFKRWLNQQRDRDDPIGDLAYDARRDRDFPDDADKVVNYLRLRGACWEAVEAAEEAIAKWKSS